VRPAADCTVPAEATHQIRRVFSPAAAAHRRGDVELTVRASRPPTADRSRATSRPSTKMYVASTTWKTTGIACVPVTT